MNGSTESGQKHGAGRKPLGCSTHAHQSQHREHPNNLKGAGNEQQTHWSRHIPNGKIQNISKKKLRADKTYHKA